MVRIDPSRQVSIVALCRENNKNLLLCQEALNPKMAFKNILETFSVPPHTHTHSAEAPLRESLARPGLSGDPLIAPRRSRHAPRWAMAHVG